MLSSYIIAFLASFALASAQTTGQLGNAVVASGEPVGVSYQAVLPNSNTTGIRGQITGTTNANGTGTSFNVNFYGFPDEATFGPFSKSAQGPHAVASIDMLTSTHSLSHPRIPGLFGR